MPSRIRLQLGGRQWNLASPSRAATLVETREKDQQDQVGQPDDAFTMFVVYSRRDG